MVRRSPLGHIHKINETRINMMIKVKRNSDGAVYTSDMSSDKVIYEQMEYLSSDNDKNVLII